MPRVLFSLYDTAETKEFALAFHNLGWEIISTKETAALLSETNIPTTSIEAYTGVHENYGIPPTLHPKIESALTGDHIDWRIDIVYDIPYPLSKGNDIGGLTLLALAVKGGRLPVMTRTDMERVISELEQRGEISGMLKSALITKANAFIASHYIELLRLAEDAGDGTVGVKSMKLLNGENPYQTPCHLFAVPDGEDPLSMHRFKLLSGEAPCFTNLADLDCIVYTLCLAHEAFLKKFGRAPFLAVAAKHGNPCGFAADWRDPGVVVEKALFGNPGATWGGEFITNFAINEDLAALFYESDARKERFGSGFWMLDLVAAPSFLEEALAILGKRRARKVLENKALEDPRLFRKAWGIRPVRGGFIRQPPFSYVLDFDDVELTTSDLSDENYGSLILAWATSWSSSLGGNEVALVKDLQLIGAGGGPATTVAASNGVIRAREGGHCIEGAVFAADAFFPYIDAPEILADSGCVLGLVPRGGKHEKEVRSFFQSKDIDMCFLPEQFRGFCRH